jgi:hypothetical protein
MSILHVLKVLVEVVFACLAIFVAGQAVMTVGALVLDPDQRKTR